MGKTRGFSFSGIVRRSMALFALALLPPAAFAADITRTLNYQGFLADNNGLPIDNAKDMRFRLFSAATGGSQLFEEARCGTNAVGVAKGRYEVEIGSKTAGFIPASVFQDNGAVWLQVEVDTNDTNDANCTGATFETLLPRIRLQAAPYTFKALHASTAAYVENDADAVMNADADGGGGGDVRLLINGTEALYIGNDGKVGLATTGPSARLHVTEDLNADTSVLFQGNQGAPDVSGAGHRFMWIPSSGAIRGGGASSTEWDAANIGPYSAAFGSGGVASGEYATVGGGRTSTASGDYATVAGGINNVASGEYSFAAGRRAKATARGAFVWADSLIPDLLNVVTDQFLIRAQGGFEVRSSSLALVGTSQTLFTVDASSAHFRVDLYDSGGNLITGGAAASGWTDDGSAVRLTDAGDNVGIGTTGPAAKLHVSSTGVLFDGDTGAPSVSGPGHRFMWIPSSGAIRAGGAGADGGWDAANIGPYSVAFGSATQADGSYNVVGGGLGNRTDSWWSTVGGGQENIATGDHSTVSGGRKNAAMEIRATVGGASTTRPREARRPWEEAPTTTPWARARPWPAGTPTRPTGCTRPSRAAIETWRRRTTPSRRATGPGPPSREPSSGGIRRTRS